MRVWVTIVGLVVALAVPAAGSGSVGARMTFPAPLSRVMLVTPQGAAVGGRWQRWVDEAKVPTPRGSLILDVHPARDAHCPAGCSAGPPFYGPAYEVYANDRDGLYFELGHIVDWRELTWRDRRAFARLWGVYGHRWLDSRRSLAHGGEDGLEATFARAYAFCAWGEPVDHLEIAAGPPIRNAGAPTCRLIARLMAGRTAISRPR